MSSAESNKMSNPTPSQDSLYRDAIIDAAKHGWDDLLDKADQPANPFAEELWLMEKKKAQQQETDDIIVNMDGGVGGSWQTTETPEERNTRHSVDKGEEFVKSGMTLITDIDSDKYLKSSQRDSK